MNLIKNTIIVAGLTASLAAIFSTAVFAAEAETNKEVAVGILEQGLVKGDTAFLEKNVAKSYIQHNPNAPGGLEGLLGLVGYLGTLETPVTSRPVRVIRDGALVAVHSEFGFGGQKAVVDIFRFEGGKAVEHWDGIQAIPAGTKSGRTMLDGPAEIKDRNKTDINRALVKGFVTDVLINGEADKLTQYIGETYHQHNPLIADGIEGLGEFIGYLAQNNISFSYKKIHQVLAEGNFVVTLSEGELAGKITAFYDIFRVADGKIVEHWDVIQEVPVQMAHGNGMF